jgi:hypothetical protein
VSKEVLPLDQVKDEIHNKLKGERLKEMMDKYANSVQSVTNEAYFGPAPAAGPPHRPHPTQMQQGQPQGGAPQSSAAPSAPAQAPAATIAPTKPN